MHNPESGKFEAFKTIAEAMQRQSQATKGKTQEEKKHWRIFSKGETVHVEGVPMVVKNIGTPSDLEAVDAGREEVTKMCKERDVIFEELDRLQREAEEEQESGGGVAALIRYADAVWKLAEQIVYE